MKRPSFQRRIALLTAALAGSALIGFGLLSAWLIREAKIDRLDARLENALMRSARRRSGGWPQLQVALEQQLGQAAVALQVTSPTGEQVYQSATWPPELNQPLLPPLPRDFRRPPSLSRWHTQRLGGTLWRVGGLATPRGQVAVAVSLQSLQQEMTAIYTIYLVTIPGGLLVMAAAAWLVAGQALIPVRRLSQTMGQVTVQGLHQRVPRDYVDVELGELIEVFNQMLERLERSFHQARRFSGDAAHELKTPLAILQGELEQAIQQAPTGSPMQATLGNLLTQVTHLSGIVRKLLLLSLADAGQMVLQRQPVNVSQLLQEQLEDIPWLAPELSITADIQPGLWGSCDRDLLLQVLQNLISNAIKYNLPQGWIRVRAADRGGQIHISIANAARPVATHHQERLFERFYRGDAAHSSTAGLGLGLSLAREIAQAHGGNLTLARADGEAISFTLTLPGETAPPNIMTPTP